MWDGFCTSLSRTILLSILEALLRRKSSISLASFMFICVLTATVTTPISAPAADESWITKTFKLDLLQAEAEGKLTKKWREAVDHAAKTDGQKGACETYLDARREAKFAVEAKFIAEGSKPAEYHQLQTVASLAGEVVSRGYGLLNEGSLRTYLALPEVSRPQGQPNWKIRVVKDLAEVAHAMAIHELGFRSSVELLERAQTLLSLRPKLLTLPENVRLQILNYYLALEQLRDNDDHLQSAWATYAADYVSYLSFKLFPKIEMDDIWTEAPKNLARREAIYKDSHNRLQQGLNWEAKKVAEIERLEAALTGIYAVEFDPASLVSLRQQTQVRDAFQLLPKRLRP